MSTQHHACAGTTTPPGSLGEGGGAKQSHSTLNKNTHSSIRALETDILTHLHTDSTRTHTSTSATAQRDDSVPAHMHTTGALRQGVTHPRRPQPPRISILSSPRGWGPATGTSLWVRGTEVEQRIYRNRQAAMLPITKAHRALKRY